MKDEKSMRDGQIRLILKFRINRNIMAQTRRSKSIRMGIRNRNSNLCGVSEREKTLESVVSKREKASRGIANGNVVKCFEGA